MCVRRSLTLEAGDIDLTWHDIWTIQATPLSNRRANKTTHNIITSCLLQLNSEPTKWWTFGELRSFVDYRAADAPVDRAETAEYQGEVE
jgi:hypothetical protein